MCLSDLGNILAYYLDKTTLLYKYCKINRCLSRLKVTRRMSLVEQELHSLPEHLSSLHLEGSCCTSFSFMCSVLQINPLGIFLLFFGLCIVRILFTASDYRYSIFKLFLASNTNQLELTQTTNIENMRKREDVLRAVTSLSTNIHLFSCSISV